MKDKIFPPGSKFEDVLAEVEKTGKFSIEQLAMLHSSEKIKLKADANEEMARLTAELEHATFMRAIVRDLISAWNVREESLNAFMSIQMQSNDCSRLHKLMEAFGKQQVGWIDENLELQPANGKVIFPFNVQSFVVEHDWAPLIDEKELIGDYQLPFENCAFEFRVSNRTVIVLASKDEQGVFMRTFYESKEGHWLNISTLGYRQWEQKIQAICIMLEAEVAVREVQRVPHKLAAKRAATGKLPMYDFHTLSLAKRFRTSCGAPGNATGAQKRLHFVRGHWRHYEEHKTWIKWHLRGDETLGFADKNYKV